MRCLLVRILLLVFVKLSVYIFGKGTVQVVSRVVFRVDCQLRR